MRAGGAEGRDGGPVGFFGAVDDGVGDASGGEVGENFGEMRRKRGGREVVVGVEIHRAAENERLTIKPTKDTKVGIGFGAYGTHGIHGKEGSGEKSGTAGVGLGGRGGECALLVEFGEGVDALADGGEAVAAGGGEVLEEVERGQRIGCARGDFGGRGVVKELNQKDDEAAHEGRVGISVELEAALVKRGGEPDGGDAAKDAVGVRAGFSWERQVAAGSVDDKSETFLKVVDGGEVFEEGLKFGVERHGGRN